MWYYIFIFVSTNFHLSFLFFSQILSIEVKGNCITIHVVVSLSNTKFFRHAFISTSVGCYFFCALQTGICKIHHLSYVVPDTNIKSEMYLEGFLGRLLWAWVEKTKHSNNFNIFHSTLKRNFLNFVKYIFFTNFKCTVTNNWDVSRHIVFVENTYCARFWHGNLLILQCQYRKAMLIARQVFLRNSNIRKENKNT